MLLLLVMVYKCEYCGTNFTRKTTLRNHQQTVQYCLDIQQIHTAPDTTNYPCTHCNTTHKTHKKLCAHQANCVSYHVALKETAMQKLLDEKDRQIKQLQNQINELTREMYNALNNAITQTPAKKGVADNRNVVLQNAEPVTEEGYEEAAQKHLTIEFLRMGVDGLIDFSLNYPQHPPDIICTDRARKKLRFKQGDGTIIDDAQGHRLSQIFFSGINSKSQALVKEEYAKIMGRVQRIVTEERAHEEDVTSLMLEAMRLKTLAGQCDELAKGKDNELRNEFIAGLAKKLH